jgi:alkylhydroperoxidase family enzyme
VRSAAARQAGVTEADLDDADRYEESTKLSAPEKLALRYADQMQRDPAAITSEWYAELHRHYTEAQVMELAVFVALNLGFHAVFSTLEFTPAWAHIGPGGRVVERAAPAVPRAPSVSPPVSLPPSVAR